MADSDIHQPHDKLFAIGFGDPSTRQKTMSLAQQLRQEGRQEATAEAFMRQVNRKFPSVAARVAPLLMGLEEERLFCFGEALLFMQTPEECLQWFDA